MDEEQKIKVAIVDDHFVVREGLVRQLMSDERISVIYQATHGKDLLQQLAAGTSIPDVTVTDLKMPVMDGFTLVTELRKQYPEMGILVLTAFRSEFNVALMINKGANGYLLKDCSPDEFRRAIHSIYEEGYYYSELADPKVFRVFQNTNIKAVNIPDREMEFLKLCCTDLRYDQIAEKMGISTRTLDGCRERLFDRLGVSSRIALVLLAMSSGLVVNESYNPNYIKIKS